MTAYKFKYKNVRQWPSIQAALTLNDIAIISKNGMMVEVNVTDKKTLGNIKRNKALQGVKWEKLK